MRYGSPSVASALKELKEKECTKIVVLPLYGQYSSATSGSTFDALTDELKTWRWVPDIRTIMSFHDHPGYINALAKSITSHWVKNGRAEKLVMSFHGVPRRYIMNGDPYHCHCQKTARLVGEQLGLTRDDFIVSFQSLFGKEEWIKPYTSATLEYLAKNGTTSVDVICPGFIADCVETLEEIEDENREVFMEAGGEKFSYIPSLNARSDAIDFFSDLIIENSLNWLPITKQRQVSYKAYQDYDKVSKAQCPFLKK
jgi:ferrochelatase